MNSCAEFVIKISAEDADSLVIEDFAEEFLDDLGSQVHAITGLPVAKGLFSGCIGRVVGEREVSAAINFCMERTESPTELKASAACWEAPASRFIFFSRPITPVVTKNLEVVVGALKITLESDARVENLVWMDVDKWARGEQDDDDQAAAAGDSKP